MRTVSLLCAKMSHIDIIISGLLDEIRHLKQHSMKYNLLIRLDNTTVVGKDIESEDLVSAVRQFVNQVTHVPNRSNFYIPVPQLAHK